MAHRISTSGSGVKGGVVGGFSPRGGEESIMPASFIQSYVDLGTIRG